jgi:hypothetical protein
MSSEAAEAALDRIRRSRAAVAATVVPWWLSMVVGALIAGYFAADAYGSAALRAGVHTVYLLGFAGFLAVPVVRSGVLRSRPRTHLVSPTHRRRIAVLSVSCLAVVLAGVTLTGPAAVVSAPAAVTAVGVVVGAYIGVGGWWVRRRLLMELRNG